MSSEPLLVAGYVIARLATAPPSRSLPARILTISDCIMDDLPQPEFWDWYQTKPEARAAQVPHPGTRLITVALSDGDASTLIDEEGGPEQPSFELLGRRLPPDGTLLGFEVVGAEETLDFHSWHCYDYANDVKEELGIQVNELGLLEHYAEAVAVLSWMLARPADQAPATVPWVVVGLFAETN